MRVQYLQISTVEHFESFIQSALGISRTDINPLFHKKDFILNKKIGLYQFRNTVMSNACVIPIDEQKLMPTEKWVLSSPSVYSYTLKTLDDLNFIMSGSWAYDQITHPVAKRHDIHIAEIIAYRLKCFMRKLFSPKFLTTPQLIVQRFDESNQPLMQFAALVNEEG